MIHVNDNSYRDLDCNNGDSIQCNLRQALPHTAVCSGKSGLSVLDGACIINCDLPAGTTFGDRVCNPHFDFCANIEDNETLGLPAEPIDCRHSAELLDDNGDLIYSYENIKVA